MPKRSSKKKPKEEPLVTSQIREAVPRSYTEEERLAKKERRKKNPAAVALGKLGGKKGGTARAKKLSPKRRKEIAKKAALVRWSA